MVMPLSLIIGSSGTAQMGNDITSVHANSISIATSVNKFDILNKLLKPVEAISYESPVIEIEREDPNISSSVQEEVNASILDSYISTAIVQGEVIATNRASPSITAITVRGEVVAGDTLAENVTVQGDVNDNKST